MNEKKKQDVVFHPDRPIQSGNEDRLGFGVIADNLATSILNAGAREGFVIGIEGPWGCGKSSILNLLCAKIEDAKNLSIVKFAPWVVGNRDNMVSSLMTSLSSKIDEVESKTNRAKKKLTDGISLAETVRKYGSYAGRAVSPFAKLAVAAQVVPGAEAVAKAVEALAGIDEKPSIPLTELKDKLTTSLKELGHTFVVVVDDIDRLEPNETVEIMRLIRAVGDFPNVIYVLCYDKQVLTSSLKAALSIDSGSTFLQKIVQASFAVPKPGEFDLRRWLNEECQKLYEIVTGQLLDSEKAERLRGVCDSQGEEIVTPREIILVLNSLRLAFPPICKKIDFPDLCWLHIIKVKNESFYRWIENYLSAFSVVFNGEGTVNAKARKVMAKELLATLEFSAEDDDDYSSSRSLWKLREYLPGIGTAGRRDKIEELVLNGKNISDTELSQLENDYRLASPSHYRLYFAFAQPSGILDDGLLSAILSKANSGNPPTDEFRQLLETKRAQGGTMFEVLLDRLKRYDFSKLSPTGIDAVITALVETMDDGLRSEPQPGFMGIRSVGRDGRTILGKALAQLPSKKRKTTILEVFQNGKSLGWLMADVMGNEAYYHGLLGSQIRPDKQIFSPTELTELTKMLHIRAAGKDRKLIQHVPEPLYFFRRWQQTGGTEAVKSWMNDFSKSDAGFMNLMELLRGYSVSSDIGPYRPLNNYDLESFIGAEKAKERIIKIAKNSKDAVLKKAAGALQTALAQGARKFGDN